ncbi:hypothetical protein P7C70_g6602, partial [Phenoliferia sp. Uapishka_3]
MTELDRGKGYTTYFTIFLWLRSSTSSDALSSASFPTPKWINDALKSSESKPTDVQWLHLCERFTRLRSLTLLEHTKGELHQVFSHRKVSPVEFLFLPMIVDRWWGESDGALLELVGCFRAYAFKTWKGVLRRNQQAAHSLALTSSLYSNFKLSSLKGKYRDDGRLSSSSSSGAPPPPRPRQPIPVTSTSTSRNNSPPSRLPPPAASTSRPIAREPSPPSHSRLPPAPKPAPTTKKIPAQSTSQATSRKRPNSPPLLGFAPLQKRPATNGNGNGYGSGAGSGSGAASMFTNVRQPMKEKVPLTKEQQARKEIERKNAEQRRRMQEQGSSSYGAQQQTSNGWSNSAAAGNGQVELGPQSNQRPAPNPTWISKWNQNVVAVQDRDGLVSSSVLLPWGLIDHVISFANLALDYPILQDPIPSQNPYEANGQAPSQNSALYGQSSSSQSTTNRFIPNPAAAQFAPPQNPNQYLSNPPPNWSNSAGGAGGAGPSYATGKVAAPARQPGISTDPRTRF